MAKIVTKNQIPNLIKKLKNKKIVLAGGCFDILHVGHIKFLQVAKEHGEILIILLESDATIKNLKGKNRPIYAQEDRALVLAQLLGVDYVVLLPQLKTNKDYDLLVKSIKPAIIATTKGDLNIVHKKRQAAEVGAKIVEAPNISGISTSRIAKLLHEEL